MSKNVNIPHLAKLTNIPVTETEVTKFAAQFGSTLDTIATLQELNTDTIAATPQVTNLENIYREDELDPGRQFTQAEALSNGKKTYQGYFVVPAVLHEA